MRTLLGHPEPPQRGTVYVSASLPLEQTLVDVPASDLFPASRRPATGTATTRGWISFSRNI